ncbi:hypothetical protein GCM10011391_38150 [Pullulanibacillus camelliae]|uniref:Gfo/Idh/MocA-like oxidoreductase N-terminal domain-containing protein n=1 Tax=Pullulanibacillus camelliae TaxID=1707096 RepID=A0A8J2YNM1_9BACL|nr:Gfo/Idh/MocA family oxidoreductase [Pullulanibacillus camelliae]GGE55506.1 hypothetical protein GCM10011391_38150 [Pullulanibacillus camelliae]
MGTSIRFSILGGNSYRAQYYFRIAKALPQLFQVSGAVVRDEKQGRRIEREWQVATYRNLDTLLEKETPDFVVISVRAGASMDYLLQLAEQGIAVLLETPPAADLEGLKALHERLSLRHARIQVAEQYHLHPIQQARLSIIQSGRLGEITETTVSISHFYHAVSLIRKMLGIHFEEVIIQGKSFQTTLVAGPNRAGYPTEERLVTVPRDLVWLDFGNKLGIYDFTQDQHRSWIRSNHLSVRGQRGELFDDRLTYLADYQTPIHMDLKRVNKGEKENQEGYFLYGIIAGEHWLYRNPFAPVRLYDDELAIAECLKRMFDYIQGGPSFYSLEEASQDHYLGLLMEKALKSGETIRSTQQPWVI